MAPHLVVSQRSLSPGASAQRIGEDDRVLERLPSTLAEIGGRSMYGVAQQGHTPRAPNAPRRAIDDVISQNGVLLGRLNEGSKRGAPVSYALNRFTPVAEWAGV